MCGYLLKSVEHLCFCMFCMMLVFFIFSNTFEADTNGINLWSDSSRYSTLSVDDQQTKFVTL